MKKIISIFALGLIAIFSFHGCVDKTFDEPDFPFLDPDIETNITVSEFKALYNSVPLTIEDDLVFDAVVIANDSTGNFYKKIVVQDETGGIEILIDGRDMFSKYPVGRRLFVKAKGLVLGEYHSLLQLGYAYVDGSVVAIPFKNGDDYIVGGSLRNFVEPKIVTINQLDQADLSTLIKLQNVEFVSSVIGQTFADGVNKVDLNRNITTCTKQEMIIRTSGYAQFATDTIPNMNGELTCVLGIYNSDFQGYIRSTKDINFTNERCTGATGNETLKVSIKSLRDGFILGNININPNTKIKGIVISSIAGNNLDTRNLIIQDETAGIMVRFSSAHSFSPGDEVEVIVSNLALEEYNKLLQINNTPNENSKVTGTGTITPREATISEIYINGEAWESTLVKVKNATLTGGSVYKDYDVVLEDATGSIDFYTRSSADFASDPLPSGSLDVTAIVGQYSTTYQLSIRTKADIEGGSVNPGATIFSDDFESGLTNWTAYSAKGTEVWAIDAIHGNPGACAKMSGYAGGSHENEDWLISPQINATSSTALAISFDNAKSYTGNDLELLVSSNYSGSGDPNTATWSSFSYTKSTGSFNYISSGKINLSAYIGQKFYVAFKYTSTNSDSSTWEIDNVKVTD